MTYVTQLYTRAMITYSKVAVSRYEEEVIVHKLLSDLLVHTSERVVGTSKVTSQLGEGALHQVLHSHTLLLGDTGGKTEAIDGTANTDPARVNGSIRDNIALDLAGIHVGSVLGRGADSVVFADEGVEDGSKVLVRVPVTGVDAAVLVVELNGASDGLDESEAGGLGLDSLELLPLVLGDVLGNEGVLGLDGGERPIDLGWHWLVLARVTSGEGLVFFPQGVHTVNHLLDQLHLGVSQSVLVRDIISDA